MKKILIAILVITLAGCTKEKVCSKAVLVGDAPPPYAPGWTRVILENGDTLTMKGQFEKGEIICYKQ
jgi:hypothetical protein